MATSWKPAYGAWWSGPRPTSSARACCWPAGLAALALCAVIASSLALTARAQGGAHAIMKQAEAAYNRGDYKEAAELFENAVKRGTGQSEGQAAARQYAPAEYSPDRRGQRSASRARQQYLDVLALDAGNKQALQGLMLLDTNAKQFAEAREWALKAIQADATNKGAYYTIGFIDWSMTYPDYAQRAAGCRHAAAGSRHHSGCGTAPEGPRRSTGRRSKTASACCRSPSNSTRTIPTRWPT